MVDSFFATSFVQTGVVGDVVGDVVVVIDPVDAGVELFLLDPLGAVTFADFEPEVVEAFGADAFAGFDALGLDFGA